MKSSKVIKPSHGMSIFEVPDLDRLIGLCLDGTALLRYSKTSSYLYNLLDQPFYQLKLSQRFGRIIPLKDAKHVYYKLHDGCDDPAIYAIRRDEVDLFIHLFSTMQKQKEYNSKLDHRFYYALCEGTIEIVRACKGLNHKVVYGRVVEVLAITLQQHRSVERFDYLYRSFLPSRYCLPSHPLSCLAFNNDNIEILRYLLSGACVFPSINEQIIITAIGFHHLPSVQLLCMVRGYDRPFLSRLLTYAVAYYRSYEIAQWLINEGADVSAIQLEDVMRSDSIAMLDLLLKNGLRLKQSDGWALTYALDHGSTAIFERLLIKGVSPLPVVNDLLHRICRLGLIYRLELLLQHGVTTVHLRANGDAAIRIATWNRNIEVVALLLKNGANPCAALPNAYDQGDERLIALLETAKIDWLVGEIVSTKRIE